MRQRRHRATPGRRRGFTLVEVLVAALLFAVGMIALVAMEFTALGGYANARDMTQATQAGQRVIQMMRTEAQQWRQESPSLSFPYDVDMDGDGQDDFDTNGGAAILSKARGSNGWNWNRVFVEPMDVQMTTQGAQRFCVYVRGGLVGDRAQRVQVAVVYSGPSGTVADDSGECASNGGSVNGVTLTDQLGFDGDGVVHAEREGFRVVFIGTIIQMRAYLG